MEQSNFHYEWRQKEMISRDRTTRLNDCSRFPLLGTEQAETTIIAWSPNAALITHLTEMRVFRVPTLWRGTQSLTICVPHLLFSFLHIGKVINDGLWKIFQTSQFYFQGFQLLHFSNLENRRVKSLNQNQKLPHGFLLPVWTTPPHALQIWGILPLGKYLYEPETTIA